jgi:inorganic pyrophosphatase
VHPQYKDNTELASLPEITRKVIEHFFTRYKDLEPGKWVKVVGWGDRAQAEEAISAGLKAYAKNGA